MTNEPIEIRTDSKYIYDIKILNSKVEILVKNSMTDFMNYKLGQSNGNVYITLKDSTKISIKNSIYTYEYYNDQYILYKIKGQFVYVGREYINDDINNIKKIEVNFGSKIIYEDEIHKRLFPNQTIKYNDFTMLFNGNLLEIKTNNKINKNELQDDFYNFLEILWLIYGFVPKIKYIEYTLDDFKMREYVDLVYKYNSNHEFINNNFKIANIEKINNWEEILEKWNNLKKEYNTLINGLLYSCAESNKYADMQLCNLLQSIDAISGKLFNTDLDVNKVAYIDKVINELPKSNNNYKENLIDVLNDSKNWSFKERIEKFLNLDCYNIFYIENKLFELCKMQKKNPKNCMIFSRKNQMIRRSINERNKFSHMNSNNEKSFDDNIRKYYYFKYLFLCRTILIEKIDFKDAIDSNMIIEDIKHWTNYFMNIEKDKCKECPYYKDKKCAIIKEGY